MNNRIRLFRSVVYLLLFFYVLFYFLIEGGNVWFTGIILGVLARFAYEEVVVYLSE